MDKPVKLPVSQAASLLRDRSRVAQLATRAARKADKNKEALHKVWRDLATLIRLISAWAKREYTIVPWSSILAATAALIYFVNPFDLIPDFLQVFGFIDDAAVLGLVMGAIRDDLRSFTAWERSGAQSQTRSAPTDHNTSDSPDNRSLE